MKQSLSGTFDGNHKNITGLYMNRGDIRHLGLFSLSDGIIENLNVVNCNINSYWNGGGSSGYIGGIAGVNLGIIKNCSVTGKISFNYGEDKIANTWLLSMGGITGGCSGVNASMSLNSSLTAISTTSFPGCGIENCYNGANLSIYIKKAEAPSDRIRVGGIVGTTNNILIRNCYNTGNITTTLTKLHTICDKGGIAAETEGNYSNTGIENCYNIGSINDGGTIGGILGNIYSTACLVDNCYYLNTIQVNSANGEIPLTQEQMKTATFANILNKRESYANLANWNSSYQDNANNIWSYKNNYPTLK